MADKATKDINDTKISTDTLFVLLLVICGIAAIILVAYLLYKPYQSSNDVVIRDIIVSSEPISESENIESVESSLENSYLADDLVLEVEKELPELQVKEEPIIVEPVIIAEKKPIFKPTTKVALKQTPTKTTVVRAAPKKQKLVTIKAYWIQVGSFSTSAQAGKSVEILKARGLSSRVILKTIDGKNTYRVRIGAYESKDEADKFCDEVKKIAGYEGSYVSESTSQKYVNI